MKPLSSAICRNPGAGSSLLIAGLLLAGASTRLSAAEEEVVQLGTMTVTAQKRTELLKDVAIPLTAYSGGFLEDTGVNDYRTLAPLVPGLFVLEQSPNNPGINLRGITTDSGDPRSETRVSIFQDGVSINRARGSLVDLFDMERVEVLPGPQGTLFGRGAEIGALSLVQNKPSASRSGSLSAGFGTLGERHAAGFVNAPLIADQLFGRVAFSYRKNDGTVKNLADGSDLNGRDTLAIRGSLRWQPSTATTADLILNWQHDQPPGTDFKSAVVPTRLGDTDPFAPAELTRGSLLRIDRTVDGATAIIEHRLSERWTLSSVTGWREFDAYEAFDGDGSWIPLLEVSDDAEGKQFSQELRLNLSQDRFSGFVGTSWFQEDGSQRVTLETDEHHLWPWLSTRFRDGLLASGVPAALANIAVPAMNPVVPQATLPAAFAAFANPALPPTLQALAGLAGVPLKDFHEEALINSAKTRSLDVFADGTWRTTDRLAFTLGARMTRDEITSGFRVVDSATPGRLGFITGATPNDAFVGTGGATRESSLSNTGVAGRLIAQYSFPSDLNAYASVSRGRRPAGLLLDATRRRRLSEERVWNYEVGVKQPLASGRVYWQASAYTYDYTHFQTTVADPVNLGRFIVVDAGNATGNGLEFGLSARALDNVQFFGTYGYTDATFDDTGDDGQKQQFAGNTFRLTPKHTLSLGATADFSLGQRGTVSVTPVWSHRSEIFFTDNNDDFGGRLRQDAYGLLSLRAVWRSPSRRWEIAGNAENLLDEKYIVDAGNTGNDYGTPTFVPGMPRMLTLTSTFRW